MSRATPLVTRAVSEHEAADQNRRAVLSASLLRRMFGLMQPYRSLRNKLFVTVFFRAVQLPALSWMIGRILAGLAETPPEARDTSRLMIDLGLFGLLAIFTVGTFYLRMLWALRLGERVVGDLRDAIFRHLQTQTMDFYHRTKVGRVISRVVSDAEAVRIGVQDVLFITLVQGGQMLGAALIMAWVQWRLFLILVAVAPVFWIVNRLFRRRFAEAYRAMRESFSRVTATLAESVAGVRITQGFSREAVNAKAFHELVRDHATYNTQASHLQGAFLPLLEFNTQVFLAAMLAVGGWLALHDNPAMGAGDVVYFFFLAQLFFAPIQVLGTQYTNLMEAMTGAERVFELLDTPPTWTDEPDALTPPPMRGQLAVRNLNFSYAPDAPVLKHIDFEIEPGQTVALVGATGCGKSTLASLIAKFYLPESGAILIDGHDLRRVSTRWLTDQMGVVLQQNFLFEGTIGDNIRLSRPDADDARVIQAIEQLGLGNWFAALPHGLNTPVGELGHGLSLGQRQLICFARAMLADPRLLILDEATSSIDPITEQQLQTALSSLLSGRTAVIIAHRLSTIRDADLILLMENGQILERGRHAELLRLDGAYAALYRRFTDRHSDTEP